MREKLRWLLIAGLTAAPLSASAQEHEFPALNTIGRFLGVGYSSTGYHNRRDGRFDVIKARQPAYYPSNALSYPYDPAYRPYRPAHVSPAPAFSTQPYTAPAAAPKAAPELSSDEAEEIQPEEVKPAKPVGPPPQWLKPHLNDDVDDEVLEPSPSDRNPERQEVYGELTPPRQPTNRAESPFYIEPDEVPGAEDIQERETNKETQLDDRILDSDGGNDSLLEDDLLDSSDEDLLLDDDDLILDDDDLSVRRYLKRTAPEPRTATKPGQKVSVLQSPIPTAQFADSPVRQAPAVRATQVNTQRPAGYALSQPHQFRTQPQQARQPVQYRTVARPVSAPPSAWATQNSSVPQPQATRFVGTPYSQAPRTTQITPNAQAPRNAPAGVHPQANPVVAVRPNSGWPTTTSPSSAWTPPHQAPRPTTRPTRSVPGYVISHQAPVKNPTAPRQNRVPQFQQPTVRYPAQYQQMQQTGQGYRPR